MVYEKIINNQSFLFKIVNFSGQERKRLINHCTVQELETLIELLINIRLLQVDSVTRVKIAPITSYFKKHRQLKVEAVRKLFVTNEGLLQKFTAAALERILIESIHCITCEALHTEQGIEQFESAAAASISTSSTTTTTTRNKNKGKQKVVEAKKPVWSSFTHFWHHNNIPRVENAQADRGRQD